jgi:hypothetical protein
MKNLHLTLVWRGGLNGNKDVKEIDVIEGDNFTQLLSQFMLVVVRIQQRMHEETIAGMIDDEIPF